jgi:TolB-like protein/DNA-binding winged helix-turn-helix (wHTH) protein
MSLEKSSNFLRFFSEAEMNGSEKHSYRFKSFLLNVSERRLLDADKPVYLTPKSFDTLVYLLEHAGHLVEKEELLQSVWAESFVEEGNLARTVHDLRKALGQDKNGNKFIETIPTKGYRFVADVTKVNDAAEDADKQPAKISVSETSVKALPTTWLGFRAKPLLLGLAACIILVAAFGSYFLLFKRTSATGDGRKSIAVIPFVNATNDANLDYLVDGITDNVINQLSRLSGLKVIAGHSVFLYKGKEIDLKKVADELGAQALVTGDIKQVENQLIINVTLVDPNDGSQIWGKQYVKNSLDLIATQNEISQAVAKSLRVNVTDADKRILAEHPTENAEAYQLYLKGRFFGQNQTPDGLTQSIELYSQAIDKDPRFALAYSEMGMRYVNLGIYFKPPRDVMPKARAYAEKALELDNTLSDPHIVLGLVALLYDWDWDKAKEELANGSVVNLKSMETFSCTAHVLQITGRASDVDDTMRRALDDDPISIALTTELGCNSYYARRYDESINEYREALLLGPNNFMAVYGLARTLNYKGQYQEAIDEIEKAKTFMPMLPPIAVAERSYSLGKMGKREDAEAGLKILVEQSRHIFVDPFFIATVYLSLDDREQTFAWLEKAYQARSSLMPSLVNDAKWDGLRNDPRFQNLMPRIGATEEKLAQN